MNDALKDAIARCSQFVEQVAALGIEKQIPPQVAVKLFGAMAGRIVENMVADGEDRSVVIERMFKQFADGMGVDISARKVVRPPPAGIH